MSRVSWLALFWLLGLAISSPGAQPTSSAPTLPGSESLWNSLNQIALTLPNNYDSFMASLSDQIALLQSNNQSLQDSNEQLTVSNQSLTLRNEDLQNSLAISQAAVATSESKLGLLQKALDDSMQSTTKAEASAKALAGWNSFWKITTGAGILTTVLAVVWALAK